MDYPTKMIDDFVDDVHVWHISDPGLCESNECLDKCVISWHVIWSIYFSLVHVKSTCFSSFVPTFWNKRYCSTHIVSSYGPSIHSRFQTKSYIGNSELLVTGFPGFYIFPGFSFKSSFVGNRSESELWEIGTGASGTGTRYWVYPHPYWRY